MRLLIGSDGPASLGRRSDVRSWTHRLLWFAEDGDVIVLMNAPDPDFVKHVTDLTGVDASTLRFHVMPSRWIAGNFDAWSLLDKEFQDELYDDAQAVTNVLALWPCPQIGWLVESLEIEQKLAGAAFWREGGGVLANSKALFRTLAADVGVALPRGGVCISRDDAFQLSGHLMYEELGFVVKRSYGGAGAGNEIVATQELTVSQAGHASMVLIEASPESLYNYWEDRWRWASHNNTQPVVLEQFISDARTVYSEVFCSDEGVGRCNVGEIRFKDGAIACELFPAQDVSDAVQSQLEKASTRLAEAYHALGYRGYLSLDSVITDEDNIFFTEANARFTGSTHLYESIARRIDPHQHHKNRVVVQSTTPESIRITSFTEFFDKLSNHQLVLNEHTPNGVVAVTPLFENSGQIVLATVAENETLAEDIKESVYDIALQTFANGGS